MAAPSAISSTFVAWMIQQSDTSSDHTLHEISVHLVLQHGGPVNALPVLLKLDQGEDAHDDGLIYLIPEGTTKIKKYEDDDEDASQITTAKHVPRASSNINQATRGDSAFVVAGSVHQVGWRQHTSCACNPGVFGIQWPGAERLSTTLHRRWCPRLQGVTIKSAAADAVLWVSLACIQLFGICLVQSDSLDTSPLGCCSEPRVSVFAGQWHVCWCSPEPS